MAQPLQRRGDEISTQLSRLAANAGKIRCFPCARALLGRRHWMKHILNADRANHILYWRLFIDFSRSSVSIGRLNPIFQQQVHFHPGRLRRVPERDDRRVPLAQFQV